MSDKMTDEQAAGVLERVAWTRHEKALVQAARHYRERAERAEQELRCIRGWVESDWALDCADRPTARAVIAMYAQLNGDARQAEQERDDYRDGAAAEAHEGDRARQEAAELRAEVERLTAALAHAVEQIAQAAIDCQATEEIAAVLQAQVVGLTSRLDADEEQAAMEETWMHDFEGREP